MNKISLLLISYLCFLNRVHTKSGTEHYGHAMNLLSSIEEQLDFMSKTIAEEVHRANDETDRLKENIILSIHRMDKLMKIFENKGIRGLNLCKDMIFSVVEEISKPDEICKERVQTIKTNSTTQWNHMNQVGKNIRLVFNTVYSGCSRSNKNFYDCFKDNDMFQDFYQSLYKNLVDHIHSVKLSIEKIINEFNTDISNQLRLIHSCIIQAVKDCNN